MTITFQVFDDEFVKTDKIRQNRYINELNKLLISLEKKKLKNKKSIDLFCYDQQMTIPPFFFPRGGFNIPVLKCDFKELHFMNFEDMMKQ